MATGKFEFHQLRCFVAVAEELNFRRAAERMNMTQPPLSRQIQLLEDSLGVMLFERTNRQVRLTSAGKNYYESAMDLLQRAEVSVLRVRQAERGETGSVALGFVPSTSYEFIPRIVQAMAREMPGVTLTATEMMGYEIIEAQASGRLDLGLTRMEEPRSDVRRTRAVNESFVLAVPKDHPLTTAPSPALSDLEGEDFIGYSTERGGSLRSMQQGLFTGGRITPKTVLQFSQTHTVLAMVNRGLGIALVPGSARALQMNNIRFRDIDLPKQFASVIYLVYRTDRQTDLQKRVRHLILDTLSEYA